MFSKILGWNDTIVALATPQGMGAIAVIRVSGDNSFAIVNALFHSKDLSSEKSHTLHVGYLRENDVILDEVVLSLFKAPKSYTGEDVIEISCHGSVYVQQKIVDALVKAGARVAKPGEFTMRAFLNGKMDLAQAEAVADLIASNSEASKKASLQQMRGGFSHDLRDVREQLLKFSALVELELDFAQEDVEFANRSELMNLLNQAKEKVTGLIQSFSLGNVIKNGVQVAIIGKPNAGKSTLLNTLLNEDRAIVSDIAGTTRDTIEETVNIHGILYRLIDTAGIREHTTDLIETAGVERSLHKMRNADIVLYVFDVNDTSDKDLCDITGKLEKEKVEYILVANKSDTTAAVENKYTLAKKPVFISALRQRNIELLKQALFGATVGSSVLANETIVTNARHIAALEKVKESLEEIIAGMKSKIPGDLLALDIRQCLYHLGEITGEITNEDQLDYIFSKFCIGK